MQFGGVRAVSDLHFSAPAAAVTSLIGPNGAGKTTLIQQLSGALAPDAGRIVFDGQDITALSMHERVHRGLARSYQITSIFPRLSVLDNVALALQARTGSSLRFWSAARAEAQRYAAAAAVLARVGLGERGAQLAGALSHGEQRQLEVGIALATGARLLLLDEPMAGMGPEESERMVALLQSLRGECTLLLVEHDMDAVFRLADTISVLVSGRIIASAAPEAIRADAEVKRAYLGDELEEGA
ncbi:MAG TPA: ABC transporter ATP-binding protein [Curvibacter sp.]|nr:ABC transporter ATP-binding protein [Curvibacter sp.]